MYRFFGEKSKLAQDIENLTTTPISLPTIRMVTGYTNLYRLVLTFSRLTVQQTILFLRETQWLKFLNDLLGLSLDADKMVNILNTPTELFRLLSVAIFAFRLSLNLGEMGYHWLYPSNIRTALTVWNEQWNVILNDAVWATANLFANFATYFKIAPPIAAGITACFLCFDISLLYYRKSLANLDDQPALRASFNANLLAAGLLALGFSASFILTAPALIPIEFFICSLGTGLYATADAYGTYVEKSLNATPEIANEAWGAFTGSLFKNTVLPCLLMSTVAVSLPAAALFTALYIGYELNQRYNPETEPQTSCSLN